MDNTIKRRVQFSLYNMDLWGLALILWQTCQKFIDFARSQTQQEKLDQWRKTIIVGFKYHNEKFNKATNVVLNGDYILTPQKFQKKFSRSSMFSEYRDFYRFMYEKKTFLLEF